MNRSLKWILAVLWTAFIVYGLTRTPSGIPRYPWLAIEGVDKVIHVILFGVEAFLLGQAVGVGKRLHAFYIIAWCTVLGGGLELVQLYGINGRSGDFFDLLADTVGAVFGTLILIYMVKDKQLFME